MNINGMDLNLLLVFNALIETKSVSKGAKLIGLSQPAMSHALNRLRLILDDDLFLRTPKGMVPTPKAEGIKDIIASSLGQLESGLFSAEQFDPHTHKKRFTITSSDCECMTFIPYLISSILKNSPGMSLDFRHPTLETFYSDLDSSKVDLALGVGLRPRNNLVIQKIFDEDYICLTRKDNPLVQDKISLGEYLKLEHINIDPLGGRRGIVDNALAKIGVQRNIRVSIPQFSLSPWIFLNNNLIVTIPKTLGLEFQKILPVKSFEPPVEIQSLEGHMMWHKRNDNDPAHKWLRKKIIQSVTTLRKKGLINKDAKELS
ncbi:LysR family transcriptional regulator [Halobacteriovorax sp. HLS]|uniref:LysR family transcriptional regulator n=1 Tax=Halobacteriovorax sp. HLS TaxID=2234000 RepID=UPI0013E34534|nr:LysR family transcriptional regulator [Halobacteriovorax sp. HLS]